MLKGCSRYRVAACLTIALSASLVAGCGGGGSSGGSGGTIPNPPVAPSEVPSGSPGTPTPGPTMTPVGTTPTPAPVPTTPAPVGTPTPVVASGQTIVTAAGGVDGTPSMSFNPPDQDTASGGNGQTVDGITPVAPALMDQYQTQYHVHAFLALFVNGQQVAIPYGLGMVGRGPAIKGFVNAATSFYLIHTHDSTGIIHIESPSNGPPNLASTIYTLKDFLDIWGLTVNANQFGPFTGPLEVFTSGPMSRSNGNNTTVPASTLTYYGNDPSNVPLYSHEYIVVEVGPAYPASLPNVQFYTEY